MITFRELFSFSTTEPKEAPVEDFEAAVRKTIDRYKGNIDRGEAVAALRLQADLLARDEAWNTTAPETQDEGAAETKADAEKAEDAPVEPEEDEENDTSGKGGGKKKK